MNEYLEMYGCTEEDLIAANGRDNIEQAILLDLVCDLILEEATIEEVTE